jgi:hypothetical protein
LSSPFQFFVIPNRREEAGSGSLRSSIPGMTSFLECFQCPAKDF